MVVAVEQAGVTRYTMLETLRAYARERREGHRATARRVLRRPRRGGRARRAGRRRARVDRGHAAERRQPAGGVRVRLRRARRRPRPAPGLGAARADPRARHVRGRRVGPAVPRTRRPGHPLFAAAVGCAARGAWGVGDFARADGSRPWPTAPSRRGHRAVGPSRRRRRRCRALPGRRRRRGGVLPVRGRPGRARGRPDPAGVDAVLRRDLPGRAPGARGGRRRRRGGAGGGARDRQPERAVDGPLRAGLVLKKAHPSRRSSSSTRPPGSPPTCRTSGGRASR
jgi:hypothetical protein